MKTITELGRTDLSDMVQIVGVVMEEAMKLEPGKSTYNLQEVIRVSMSVTQGMGSASKPMKKAPVSAWRALMSVLLYDAENETKLLDGLSKITCFDDGSAVARVTDLVTGRVTDHRTKAES